MNHAKGLTSVIAKGIAISVLYCIAYLVLRYYSFDQWFLPAGLRAACLFFMPLRYWPFVFIGDAALGLFRGYVVGQIEDTMKDLVGAASALSSQGVDGVLKDPSFSPEEREKVRALAALP